jgi:hypothetical protein
VNSQTPLNAGGGGEDRTPDLGVMNPEMTNFGTVEIVDDYELNQ